MKRILLALLLAVAPSIAFAQTPNYTGKLSDFSAAATSTETSSYDRVVFGFPSKRINVCIAGSSATVYARFGTTVTTSPTALYTSWTTGNKGTVPVSTSASFINDITRSLSGSTASSGAQALALRPSGTNSNCYTWNLKANGIVFHIVSGIASIDTQVFGEGIN